MTTTFKEEPITTVALKDLAGAHTLTGVDLTNETIKAWYDKDVYEDAQYFSFRLDEKTYTAIEDPSDGYRSSMQEIGVSDHALKNTFPPVQVVGVYDESDLSDDTLTLIHAVTGKPILRVGTDNADDYYPCFVSEFHPEALGIV